MTGISAPGLSSAAAVPGWQSTKYSPISDCGRAWQVTSVRIDPKPVLVISISTSARWDFSSTFISPILPARTPAILTSPPLISPNASSNSTQ